MTTSAIAVERDTYVRSKKQPRQQAETSPYLRCGGEVIGGQQERVDTIRRERRASKRLIREPHRELLIRRRLEAAPDILNIGGVALSVLRHPYLHVPHGFGRMLVLGVERGRSRRLRGSGVTDSIG